MLKNVYDTFVQFLTDIWDVIDNRKVVRRIAFFIILYITYKVAMWTINFAEDFGRSGTDTAMIIAAVWAPMGVLQGFALKLYDASRKND